MQKKIKSYPSQVTFILMIEFLILIKSWIVEKKIQSRPIKGFSIEYKKLNGNRRSISKSGLKLIFQIIPMLAFNWLKLELECFFYMQ